MSSHDDTVAPYESTGASNEAYETFIEQFITPEEEKMNRERVVLQGGGGNGRMDIDNLLGIFPT